MIHTAHAWMVLCGTALTAAAAFYTVTASLAVRARVRTAPGVPPRVTPAVTILKPLCGSEHELYECLRSFCDQAYPNFQIVFGVSDRDDPAVEVVARLQREFRRIDIEVAIDRRLHGSSRKVSNLMNMMPLARHDYLVISDSDVRVERDYLARLVGPLLDAEVGIVTCPYRGVPRSGLWSLLGALFINEWFMPSVRVAALFGSRSFAFGATIAIRRQVLASIGGFAAITNQLADDYRLGELTRRAGLRTVLSDVEVETFVDERSVGSLVRHELRWLRTIRAVRPIGYTLSFITFGVPLAACGALLAGGSWPALALLGAALLGRLWLHRSVRRPGASWALLAVLPLRDCLSLGLWAWGFVTRRVHWRNDRYRVTRDGSAEPVVRM